MTLYLGIKTKFLNEILSGEKTIEYREDTPYWRARLKKQYSEIILHQYKGPLARIEFLSVRKIKTPKFLSLIKTPKCFAIKLGKVQPLKANV